MTILVAMLAASGCASSSATAPEVQPVRPTSAASAQLMQAPVLGAQWAPAQEGYGSVAPATVFNGGDPTGLVQHITWRGWGNARAVGLGVGWLPGKYVADGHREQASLVAFHLGTCHGVMMYRSFEWYFPKAGERFDPARANNWCRHRRPL